MGMYLNLGNAGFESIRKGLYIDKTGLISFINSTLGTREKLTCALFEDLEIAKEPSFEQHLNQYDVIDLDMTWFISVCERGKKYSGIYPGAGDQ